MDPLYLSHPTRYYMLEEDAEAAKYSSLFRHRLLSNRPDWMDHATPLQLAAETGRTLGLAEPVTAMKALPAAASSGGG